MAIPVQQVQLLKNFVQLCANDPDILHSPELSFYRDYLESLGATIPEKTSPASSSDEGRNKSDETSGDSNVPVAEEEDIEPESDLELDNTGVIDADTEETLPMGDTSIDVTDEMRDQATEKRQEAIAALSDGNCEEALGKFTEAIELNPGSAVLHAKRASVLIQLNKPVTALKDCDKAISINPDSAAGYKFRGRANRLLGNWEQAYQDLVTACKLDYDDTANEWLKEVQPNARKIQEHKRKQERKKEEKLIKEKQERVRKAKEEYERQKHQASDNNGEGTTDGDGMPDLASLFSDPELMAAFQDPEVAAAFADVQQNPMNIAKHQSNPKVKKVMEKLAQKMGGAGGMPGAAFSGMPGAAFSGMPGAAFSGTDAGGPKTHGPTASGDSAPQKPPDIDID